MEENVALETAKQRKFEKSIIGIKKIIKKTKTEPEVDVKVAKGEKKKRKERGLVYLSHIPHGFYEHAMTQYFRQFGVVTNARVVRSRRSGASRGCAFVEFREPAVAQVVADTMDNYLMGKRLIKAVYIPPEKQRPKAMRKYWTSINNPAAELRLKMKKAYNANKDEKAELKRARKILANFTKTKEKLNAMGINYDFFVPVDVPEELADGANTPAVKNETGVKVTKHKENLVETKKMKREPEAAVERKLTIINKKQGVNKAKTDEGKHTSIDVKKESNKEQKNIKAKSIKSLEDFLKIQKDSEDSEGSEQFDSDEFEKMLATEEDSASASEESSLSDDDDDDESGGQNDDESIEDVMTRNKKSKLAQKAPLVQLQQSSVVKRNRPQDKRKVVQKSAAAAPPFKKSKFEKQIKPKSNSKQFKKKK